MAIAFVDSTSESHGDQTSWNVAKPVGMADGDVILAIVAMRATTNGVINTPTGGTGTWQLVPNCDQGDIVSGNSVAQGKVFYKVVVTAASEPATYGFSYGTALRGSIIVAAWRGVNTTSPIDASNSQNNAASTDDVCPSITTLTADALLVCLAADRNGGVYGIPGSMTVRENPGLGAVSSVIADEARPSTGATGTRTFTQANADDSKTFSVALAPISTPSTEFEGWGNAA